LFILNGVSQQLAVLRADARSDDTYAVRDALFGYHMMMMMMMMMDELTLMWHIVLRLQGHVTVNKESRNNPGKF